MWLPKRCRFVSGGATTIAAEIGGVEGEDNSACQSNGMAAAVRRSSRKTRELLKLGFKYISS